MKNAVIILLAVLGLSAINSSCDGPTIIGNTNIIFPDSDVSFQKHVQPFFKVSCALQGCHSEETHAAGRIMTTYSYLMFDIGNLGFIIPNAPHESHLMHKLEGRSPFLYRCYYGKLDSNNVRGMRKWIDEGALNN